jgi:hypothetical protein
MKPAANAYDALVSTHLQAILQPDDDQSLEAIIWSEIHAAQLSRRQRRAAIREVDRRAEAIFGRRPPKDSHA